MMESPSMSSLARFSLPKVAVGGFRNIIGPCWYFREPPWGSIFAHANVVLTGTATCRKQRLVTCDPMQSSHAVGLGWKQAERWTRQRWRARAPDGICGMIRSASPYETADAPQGHARRRMVDPNREGSREWKWPRAYEAITMKQESRR